jgi:hypothetical protein
MIPLCWVNLPFGQNHPTYLKFVVSMYFAITSYKSRIRKNILQSFGQAALRELEIASTQTRPDTRYGLRLDKSRVRIIR